MSKKNKYKKQENENLLPETHVELNGKVVNVQRDNFIIELENNSTVLAKISGKLRLNKIRILLEDKVRVKLSVYNLERGIIISRL